MLEEKNLTAAQLEYIELRKEILLLQDYSFKLKTALVGAIFLLFSYLFSVDKPNPLGFLVPIPFIVLFFIMGRDISYNMWKASSYCYVFGPKAGFNWEVRLHEFRFHPKIFDNQDKKSMLSSKFMQERWFYEIFCIICLLLFLYCSSIKENLPCYKIILSLMGWFFIHMVLQNPTWLNLPEFPRTKTTMIEAWEDIKNKENGL